MESIEITKSCPGILEGARVGDPIDYEVTITNTGDVPLTSVEVTDVRPGTFTTPFPTELAPGESATRTFRGEVLPSDAAAGNVNNTTTVTALAGEVQQEVVGARRSEALQLPVTTRSSSHRLAEYRPFDPVEGIEITKTCPVIPAGARVGDSITYAVTVNNTGDVD